MGISSISTPTKISDSATPTVTNVANKSQALGKDDFLKLLLAQMKYQDPMNPMDNTESIAQMAQFSSLEKMENLNTTLESFGKYQQSLNSINGANFIGKDVTFSEVQKVKTKDEKTGNITEKETAVTVNGKVTAVSYADGEPQFTVVDSDGKSHSTTLGKISNVKDSAVDNNIRNTKLNSVIAGSAMIGRTVEGTYTYKDTDEYRVSKDVEQKVKGTVKSVSFTGDTPTLTVLGEDGKDYKVAMDKVTNVV